LLRPQARRNLQKEGATPAFDTDPTATSPPRAGRADGRPPAIFIALEDPDRDGEVDDSFVTNHLLPDGAACRSSSPTSARPLAASPSFIDDNIVGPVRLALNPITSLIDEIKEIPIEFIKDQIFATYGIDVDQLDVLLKLNNKLDVAFVTINGERLPLFKPGDHEKIDAYMGIEGVAMSETLQDSLQDVPLVTFYDDPTVALSGNVEYDKTKFAGYFDSVQLAKLLLLGEDPVDGEPIGAGQLSALMTDLTGAPYEWSLLNNNGNHGGNIFTTTLQKPGQVVEIVSDDGVVSTELSDTRPWLKLIDGGSWRDDIVTMTTILFRVSPSQAQGRRPGDRGVVGQRDAEPGLSRPGVVARERHPAVRRPARPRRRPRRVRSRLQRHLSNLRRCREHRSHRGGRQHRPARLQSRSRRRRRHLRLPARHRQRAHDDLGRCRQPPLRERRRSRFRRARLPAWDVIHLGGLPPGITGARSRSPPSSRATSRSSKRWPRRRERQMANESLVKRLVVNITSGVLRVELANDGDGHVIAGPVRIEPAAAGSGSGCSWLARIPTLVSSRISAALRTAYEEAGTSWSICASRPAAATSRSGKARCCGRVSRDLHRLAERPLQWPDLGDPTSPDPNQFAPGTYLPDATLGDLATPFDALAGPAPPAGQAIVATGDDVRIFAGDVVIDSITGDGVGGADSITIQAGGSVRITGNVGAGGLAGLVIEADSIFIDPGVVIAVTDDVYLHAVDTENVAWSFGSAAFQGIDSDALIEIGDAAVIQARDIRLETDASTLKSATLTVALDPADPSGLEAQISTNELIAINGVAAAVISESRSAIKVRPGARLTATRDVFLHSDALAEAAITVDSPAPYLGITYGSSSPTAEIEVDEGVVISAGEDVEVQGSGGQHAAGHDDRSRCPGDPSLLDLLRPGANDLDRRIRGRLERHGGERVIPRRQLERLFERRHRRRLQRELGSGLGATFVLGSYQSSAKAEIAAQLSLTGDLTITAESIDIENENRAFGQISDPLVSTPFPRRAAPLPRRNRHRRADRASGSRDRCHVADPQCHDRRRRRPRRDREQGRRAARRRRVRHRRRRAPDRFVRRGALPGVGGRQRHRQRQRRHRRRGRRVARRQPGDVLHRPERRRRRFRHDHARVRCADHEPHPGLRSQRHARCGEQRRRHRSHR
jgi:hypothetical protein